MENKIITLTVVKRRKNAPSALVNLSKYYLIKED